MSAFIVNDSCINKIVTHLSVDRNGRWLRDKIAEAGYDLTKKGGCELFAQALSALNRDAVNQRYQEAEKLEKFKYRPTEATLVQVIKNLKCLIYQCSEGDIDQRPLYKLLRVIDHELLTDYVRQSLEYEMATWGA